MYKRLRAIEQYALLTLITCWGCSNGSDAVTPPGSGGAASVGGGVSTGGNAAQGGSSALGTTSATGGDLGTGGVESTGGAQPTGGAKATGGTKATGGAPTTGGTKASGGASSTGGDANTGGVATGGKSGGGGKSATGGKSSTGGSSGQVGTGGKATGGAAATGGSSSGTCAGTASPCAPTEPNSIAYIGCSMAYNIGTGYKAVGGKIMWNSDSYQTGAMVVGNWTNSNSSSWQLFDQKMNANGGKNAVKAIMVQICIINEVTDNEVKQMIAAARNHVNPDAHIYLVGQPQYEAGHTCSIAGGKEATTEAQAKRIGADTSVDPHMSYLGTFFLNCGAGECADSCHANGTGEQKLGNQAKVFWGG